MIETVSILRANRLAFEHEKARAWDALMAYSAPDASNVDAMAIQHAADVLCDAVTYRIRNEMMS